MQAEMLLSAQTLVELLKGVGLLALVSVFYSDIEQRLRDRPALWPIACGLLFGTAAVLSMVQPIHVAPGVIVDARSVMMGLVAPMAGPMAASVAAAEASAYRLWLGGAGAMAGVLSILLTAGAGAAFAAVARTRRARLVTRDMLLLGTLVGPANLVGLALLPRDVASVVLVEAGPALIGMGWLGTAFLGTLLLRERRRLDGARQLRESEARYRLLTECISDAICKMGPDGVVTFASGSVEHVLGYAPADLIGQRFADLFHPTDRAELAMLPQASSAMTPEMRLSGRVRRKDGRWIWVEAGVGVVAGPANGAPARYVMALRDVSRRVEAEAALRESETRYRLLTNNVSDIIMRVSLDGARTYCSGAVKDVLGLAPEDLVGRSFLSHVRMDDRATLSDLFARLMRSSPRETCTFQMQHKDGHWVWMEASARLLADPATGAPAEAVFVVRDITERRRMEDALEEARLKAEQANQAKGTFLASLSHELRTPLNAIIGFADLISKESFGPTGDPQYVQFATDIRDSGHHLLGLINEILDHAKAEAGRLRLEEGTVDLTAAVRFCTRMLKARAERSGVALTAAVAPEVQYIRADEGRVRQILLNLLGNAVKYTPSGGRVTVTATLEDGAPIITVSDTGIGIDEKDVPRVLQAFEQVENSANRQLTGTGLGLPLTRYLVELHGGDLRLNSRVGEGTTFVVRLPAERLVTDAPDTQDEAPEPGAATILVVDDDSLVREGTVAVLEGYGHRVLQAANANEALALLRGGVAIQLLVTDVIMPPGMSGIELARQAHRLQAGIAVIVTSGFATHTLVDGDSPDVPYAMLSKPYSALELKVKVDTLLAAPRRAEPASVPVPAPPPPEPATMPAPSLRILVVDDLDPNRKVALAILRSAGHRADAVDDGAAAVAAVTRKAYDLVLMDVQMAGMDGLEATRRIRALPPPAGGITILAMTAGTLPEQLDACREAGMDGTLLKPLDSAGLLTAVAGAANVAPVQRPAPVEDNPVLNEFILDELRYMLSDDDCAELIDGFLQELPRRLAAMRDALATPAVLERTAHELVSFSGNVGLRALPAHCRTLCEAAHSGATADLAPLVDMVETAAGESVERLKAYRARMPAPL